LAFFFFLGLVFAVRTALPGALPGRTMMAVEKPAEV
jgi:hypothetical protein